MFLSEVTTLRCVLSWVQLPVSPETLVESGIISMVMEQITSAPLFLVTCEVRVQLLTFTNTRFLASLLDGVMHL